MEPERIKDEVLKNLATPWRDILDGVGVTENYLAKRLKKELNSKETKTIKFKGALDEERLPKTASGKTRRGYRIVSTSGFLSYAKDGGMIFGDGDTVIEIDMINWTVSQKARMDAHKLRGDYPAQKHEHSGPEGAPIAVAQEISKEDRELLRNISDEVIKEIVERSLANSPE